MAFDFKKEYKEFYMPKNKPDIVTVPCMNYIAVRGSGDPNQEDEEVYVNVPQEDGSIKPVLVGEHKDRKDSNQTVSYRNQPQTGDETPIAIFIGLLVLALTGIGMILWRKRKLNKNV